MSAAQAREGPQSLPLSSASLLVATGTPSLSPSCHPTIDSPTGPCPRSPRPASLVSPPLPALQPQGTPTSWHPPTPAPGLPLSTLAWLSPQRGMPSPEWLPPSAPSSLGSKPLRSEATVGPLPPPLTLFPFTLPDTSRPPVWDHLPRCEGRPVGTRTFPLLTGVPRALGTVPGPYQARSRYVFLERQCPLRPPPGPSAFWRPRPAVGFCPGLAGLRPSSWMKPSALGCRPSGNHGRQKTSRAQTSVSGPVLTTPAPTRNVSAPINFSRAAGPGAAQWAP